MRIAIIGAAKAVFAYVFITPEAGHKVRLLKLQIILLMINTLKGWSKIKVSIVSITKK